MFAKEGSGVDQAQLFIERNIDTLQRRFESSQWLGVVFADGNALGQIFINMDHHLNTLAANGISLGSALKVTRLFSEELEAASEWAFVTACRFIDQIAGEQQLINFGQRTVERRRIPIIPLILAGDDMTVLVQGEYALPFARRFLEALEERTGDATVCPTIKTITEVALGAPRLSAGAGVALVKHHFPFHLAHTMAESLLQSAKGAKQKVRAQDCDDKPFPVSTLDFHVLHDSSYTRLDMIRDRRLTVGSDRLYGGPYVVTPTEQLSGATAQGKLWCEQNHINHLITRIVALQARDTETGRLFLPNSQMHALREALIAGKQMADQRLAEIARHDFYGLEHLKEPQAVDDPPSLFFQRDHQYTATRFLDALTGVGFWSDTTERIRKNDQNVSGEKP